jgi:type 1 glutamine amidotransferase
MAQRKGWALVGTDKGGVFTTAVLRQFDAVIWNNVSGDVLTLSQRRALRRWIERGGAFIGVHGTAGDPVYFWDWYADTLIGARFTGHPTTKHFQNARIVVDARDHPIAQGLPDEWVMRDEWYSFKSSPRASGSRIIATLDEATYDPETWGQQSLRMGDHPIAWARCVGKGRMFYSAIGHRPESYVNPQFVTMFESAIGWAVSKDHGECSA